MKLANRYCPTCVKQGTAVYASPNHVLHLLLCIASCWLWLPIWIWIALLGGSFQCQACGSRTYTSKSGMYVFRTISGAAITVMILFAVIAGLGMGMRSNSPRVETAKPSRPPATAPRIEAPKPEKKSPIAPAPVAKDHLKPATPKVVAETTVTPKTVELSPLSPPAIKSPVPDVVSTPRPVTNVSPQPDPVAKDEKREKAAVAKLRLARQLLDSGKTEAGKRWLQDVISGFPGTKAAGEAAEQLKGL